MNANTTNTTVTREALKNGKFRFRVNGEVTLKASNRAYEWASLYKKPNGEVVAWFHARQDLAVKGNSEANGISDLTRVGVTEIEEYTTPRVLSPEEHAEVQREMDLDTINELLDTNPWNTDTTEENTMTENTATETPAAKPLTAREIAGALIEAGVPFKKSAKKEELQTLLDAYRAGVTEPLEVAEPAKAEKKAEPKKPAAPRRSEVVAPAEGKRVVAKKNYTVKECAELLAASPISVNRWVQMGKLTAVKSDPKDGRVVNLIPGASVAEFLKGRADRAKSTAKAAADKVSAKEQAAAERQAKKDAKAAAEKEKLAAARAQAAKVNKSTKADEKKA